MERPGHSAATRADEVDRAARSALAELCAQPDVVRAGIALSEGGGRRLRFLASDAADWCHIDAYDDVPLTAVARTGEPVVATVDALEPRFAGVAERQRSAGVHALAALPLRDEGHRFGGAILFFGSPQVFDDAQRGRLETLVEGCAATLRRAPGPTPRRRSPDAGTDPPAGLRRARVAVPDDPRAVGEARRFVRRHLGEWELPEEIVDTAVLCVSELVTNVVMHAATASEVDARLDDGLLTVRVRDRGARPPAPPPVAPDASSGGLDRAELLDVHGRGLRLVDALSTQWGSELEEDGTTVWFTLATG